MNGTKNIYIIRHGETEFNRQNIVQGSGVDMGLNNYGIIQAQKFYAYYKHITFEHIYTSALIRTQQSVSAFLDKGITHTVLPELNEISWGDFEGKKQNAEQKAFYQNLIEHWSKGDFHAKVPNGESPIEMQNRQLPAAKAILENTTANNILVCMHGRAMKSFLCLILNKPLNEMERFQHTNLCLYQLQKKDNQIELIKSNDTSHLL
jgi:probable phosphoglycerate mutase